MAGLFIIRPKAGANITCYLTPTDGAVYTVLNYDWAEQERQETAFSDENPFSPATIVDKVANASLRFLISGDTPAEIAANRRALTQALNQDGYIEFRPHDFPSNVISTWYWYRPSGNPRRLTWESKGDTPGLDFGDIYQFSLPILTWATSDPEDYVLIKTGGVSNSVTNYLDVVPADFDHGDVTFPKVVYNGTGHVSNKEGLIITKQVIGVSEDFFYIEGEDLQYLSGTDVVDAAASGGEYGRTNTSDDADIPHVAISYMKEESIGKHFVIACLKVESGGDYDIDFYTKGGNDDIYERTGLKSITHTDWRLHFDWESLSFPPFPVPQHFRENVGVDFFNALADPVTIWMGITNNSPGAEYLHIDLLIFEPLDWVISIIEDAAAAPITGKFVVFARDGVAYKAASGDDTLLKAGVKIVGSPITSLMLKNNESSRFRFMYYEGDNKVYSANDSGTAFVYGVYGTIYPFETS